MSLAPGTRLGVYSVTAQIGAGGMGEVYRATDTSLNRDVALKVLPDAFASDAERLARFQREAEVLASLNHPNIAAIHGLEEGDGTRALVLELVEGPTLADRIAQGPIPLEEAVAIARQIAEALEAAHEAGVVHRDLKPANVKVKEDGTVKVLDFGLAKALEGDFGDPAESPTLTAAATQQGVIMGTAAYMSPEQAAGRPVDKRGDIWSFGVVLFEMLTGQRLFTGETVSHVLGAVLQVEPKWETLPTPTPQPLRRLLKHCLHKERKRRLRDIGEALTELDDALMVQPTDEIITAVVAPFAKPAVWRAVLPWVAGSVVVGGVIVGLAVWGLTQPDAPRLARFPLGAAPSPTLLAGNAPSLAVSPDGTRVVYVSPGGGGGGGPLYVRQIDQLEAVPLRGAEGVNPFFSPDGNTVAFRGPLADDNLYRVSILGGPPVTLTEELNGIAGASWGPDDSIVLAPGAGPLFRLPAAGGERQPLTELEDGETAHRWPEFLPGGEAVLFTVVKGPGAENMEIWVLDLTSDQRTLLIPGGSNPHYAPSGHVVYGVDGTLRAVPFDLNGLEVTGDTIPVLEEVVTQDSGAAYFSIGRDGSLVYVRGEAGGEDDAQRTLVWVDRDGREESLGMPPRAYDWPRVSPDGRRVVTDTGLNGDLFLYNRETGLDQQFTFDAAPDRWPLWSKDGSVILFTSERAGGGNLYMKPADGSGSPEPLTSRPINQTAWDLSADGANLVIAEFDPEVGWVIATLEIGDGSPPERLLQTEFPDGYPAVSPNRRWLLYRSEERGSFHIYVRPFPDVNSGGQWLITTDGNQPRWGPDGDELFYRGPEGIMAVQVETGGDTFEHGTPELLFPDRYYLSATMNWDVAADGKFLMVQDGTTSGETRDIILVQNFDEELTRLFPDQ